MISAFRQTAESCMSADKADSPKTKPVDIFSFVFPRQVRESVKVRKLGSGGNSQVNLYGIKRGDKPLELAVKEFPKMYLKRKRDVISAIGYYNECVALSTLLDPRMIRAVAFRSRPRFPFPVREAMSKFIMQQQLSGDEFREAVDSTARVFRQHIKCAFRAYVLMEFFDGVTLDEFIKDGIDVRTFRVILVQCLLVVNQLHTRGIMHNDLKPNNFLVRKSDLMVKLCDLGGCTSEDYQAMRFAWTPEYVAPERSNQGRIGSTLSDVYSLGVTFNKLIDKVRWGTASGLQMQFRRLAASMVQRCPLDRPKIDGILLKHQDDLFKAAELSYEFLAKLGKAEQLHVCRAYSLPAPTALGPSFVDVLSMLWRPFPETLTLVDPLDYDPMAIEVSSDSDVDDDEDEAECCREYCDILCRPLVQSNQDKSSWA